MARSFSIFQYDDNGDVIEQDIHLDETGDLAVVSGLEELRQRAHCRMQMYRGEDIFDRSLGLPLQAQILERPFSPGIVSSVVTAELHNLPEIQNVQDVVVSVENRKLTYTAQRITSDFGEFELQVG